MFRRRLIEITATVALLLTTAACAGGWFWWSERQRRLADALRPALSRGDVW